MTHAFIYMYVKYVFMFTYTYTYIIYMYITYIYISHPPKDLPFLAFVDAKEGWEPFAKTK
jgi:hypothetical protein